ncbi:MAG: type II toxin-antitoxin system HicB family antitoxin [Elusimicrobia bacterium]|nr:type II toxin-antitoxin system HicB family antitoxin [Elusimicrobiota bacterium]
MKTYKFPVIVELDEDGWYIGIVPDLKSCHAQAKSISELENRLKEVIKLCLDVEKGKITQNTFVGVHQVEVAA